MQEDRFGLTEREAEVVRCREEKMTFREIGARFGISANRASQVFQDARRKLRQGERYRLALERNQQCVETNFTRGELLVIQRGLRTLIWKKEQEIIHTLDEMRRLGEEDHVYRKARELIKKIEGLL